MLSNEDSKNQLKIMNACYKRLSSMKGKVSVGLDNTFTLDGDFTSNELRQIAEIMDMYLELKKSFNLPENISDALKDKSIIEEKLSAHNNTTEKDE